MSTSAPVILQDPPSVLLSVPNAGSIINIPPWATATAYSVGFVVLANGICYYCSTQHTSGATFDYTKWLVVGTVTGGVPTFPVGSYGAKSDGSTDDTAAAQAADAACAAAGGGLVLYPTGKQTVIGGQVTVSQGVTHGSPSWGPFDVNPVANSPTPVILVPNTSLSPFVFGSINARVQDLAFYYPNQISVTSASAPTVYPATIQTPVSSAGCHIRRVTLINAYNGLYLLGGRHHISECNLGCLFNPFTVDHSFDVIRLSKIQCTPFWNIAQGLGYPQTIDTWVQANQVVGDIFRADQLMLESLFAFSGNIGLRMQDSTFGGMSAPFPSYGTGVQCNFDTFATGILCKSTQSPGWRFTDLGVGASTTNISTPAGGGTAPKIKVRGGTFWGSNKGVTNTAGGMDVEGVVGYNPIGFQTAPGFPASTVIQASPFPSRMMVTIFCGTGVSVSSLVIGSAGSNATGITIAANGYATVIVPPNVGVTVTYAGGTPTWTWVGF